MMLLPIVERELRVRARQLATCLRPGRAGMFIVRDLPKILPSPGRGGMVRPEHPTQ
jgi:hypothetical protein